MEPTWQILCDAGVPLGAVRPAPLRLPPVAQLRAAVASARRELPVLGEPERTALLAWLSSWHHHWATSFAEVLGKDGLALLAELRSTLQDPNRYLKLRRIATENLSGVL